MPLGERQDPAAIFPVSPLSDRFPGEQEAKFLAKKLWVAPTA